MSTLLDNKKAGFNYEFLDKYSAGLVLTGGEVKTLRGHHGSLDGSYIIIRGEEAFLIGCYIPPYQANNLTGQKAEPYRNRKLLLTKVELRELIGKEAQKGLTLIPTHIYEKGRTIKLDFYLAKKKKKFDKRETIKKRETDREVRREIKNS